MGVNYCDTGCLAPRVDAPRIAISAGPVVFGDDAAGEELYLRRDTSTAFGPFGLSYGLSVTSRGAVCTGAGIVHTIEFPGSSAYLKSHFMPGL